MWTQRDQFSNGQIPLVDQELITSQHELRDTVKSPRVQFNTPSLPNTYFWLLRPQQILFQRSILGGLVYSSWCKIWKFVGLQLRRLSYRVKMSEYYKDPLLIAVPTAKHTPVTGHHLISAHLISPYLTLPHLAELTLPYLTPPHLIILHLTLHYFTSHFTLLHLILSYLTLPYYTYPYFTSPHLTSPHLSLPYFTLPHLTSPQSLYLT